MFGRFCTWGWKSFNCLDWSMRGTGSGMTMEDDGTTR
jgi:hypothetical protein